MSANNVSALLAAIASGQLKLSKEEIRMLASAQADAEETDGPHADPLAKDSQDSEQRAYSELEDDSGAYDRARVPPSVVEPDRKRALNNVAWGENAAKICQCKRSRCVKMYCVCFRDGVYCNGCNCIDCVNVLEKSDEVQQQRDFVLRKDPLAFAKVQMGEQVGCKCSKSRCLKAYCDCYAAKRACGGQCQCRDCGNTFGAAHHSTASPAKSNSKAHAPPAARRGRAQPHLAAENRPPPPLPVPPPREAPVTLSVHSGNAPSFDGFMALTRLQHDGRPEAAIAPDSRFAPGQSEAAYEVAAALGQRGKRQRDWPQQSSSHSGAHALTNVTPISEPMAALDRGAYDDRKRPTYESDSSAALGGGCASEHGSRPVVLVHQPSMPPPGPFHVSPDSMHSAGGFDGLATPADGAPRAPLQSSVFLGAHPAAYSHAGGPKAHAGGAPELWSTPAEAYGAGSADGSGGPRPCHSLDSSKGSHYALPPAGDDHPGGTPHLAAFGSSADYYNRFIASLPASASNQLSSCAGGHAVAHPAPPPPHSALASYAEPTPMRRAYAGEPPRRDHMQPSHPNDMNPLAGQTAAGAHAHLAPPAAVAAAAHDAAAGNGFLPDAAQHGTRSAQASTRGPSVTAPLVDAVPQREAVQALAAPAPPAAAQAGVSLRLDMVPPERRESVAPSNPDDETPLMVSLRGFGGAPKGAQLLNRFDACLVPADVQHQALLSSGAPSGAFTRPLDSALLAQGLPSTGGGRFAYTPLTMTTDSSANALAQMLFSPSGCFSLPSLHGASPADSRGILPMVQPPPPGVSQGAAFQGPGAAAMQPGTADYVATQLLKKAESADALNAQRCSGGPPLGASQLRGTQSHSEPMHTDSASFLGAAVTVTEMSQEATSPGPLQAPTEGTARRGGRERYNSKRLKPDQSRAAHASWLMQFSDLDEAKPLARDAKTGGARMSHVTKRAERLRHEDVLQRCPPGERSAAYTDLESDGLDDEDEEEDDSAPSRGGGPRSWGPVATAAQARAGPQRGAEDVEAVQGRTRPREARHMVTSAEAREWAHSYDNARHDVGRGKPPARSGHGSGGSALLRGASGDKSITPAGQSVFGRLMGKRVTVPRKNRTTTGRENAPSPLLQAFADGAPSPISAVAETTAAEVLSTLKDSFVAMQ